MSQELHRYPNWLARDFSATRPNEKCVLVISCIQTKHGALCLSIIQDLFDNSFVSYQMSTRQTIRMVLNTTTAS